VAIPYLRKTKGRIVNIGSVAGELTIPFQTFYSMTKASVAALSEGLNMELKPFGIKVITVMPGDTKTGFTNNRRKTEVTNELYNDRIQKSISRMEKDEQHGKNPISVSKLIYKVIRKRRPPIKTTVGVDYKFLVFLKRLLPTRFVNYILYKMYAGE
jgi:short-subunit dehydrogenase